MINYIIIISPRISYLILLMSLVIYTAKMHDAALEMDIY
jgi:hypothetical protein